MHDVPTTTDCRARILVVDDDPGNLGALGRLLHKHYRVLIAPSGERALQIAADHPPPELILLDVLMPGLDGYAVLERLRANPASRDIPVLFLSGLDAPEERAKGLALGAAGFLAKPYQPDIVLACIRQQLERRPRPGQT
jgi:putative two-component system response regulator